MNMINRLMPTVFGIPPLRVEARSPTFHSLPNELLLEIFAFLELKPYLISHGVCKKWCRLLPFTKLDPIRERLLTLYHRILNTPSFQKSLDWTDKNLNHFDREAYIACLLAQYPSIPEEYRMWILEWPARLVIQGIWPGLPFTYCRTISQLVRRSGVNWIAYEPTSPRLSALVYKLDTPLERYIPGLYIWRCANTSVWLVFGEDEDEDDADLFGRVFVLQGEYHQMGSIPFFPPRDCDSEAAMHSESRISEEELYLTTYDDWIDYVEHLWNITAKEILRPSESFIHPDRPIPRPIPYEFDALYEDHFPAPLWDSRSYRSTSDT